MDASYLRVKNWGDLQHYSDRRPPWIKVYPRLLEDDAFARLGEFVQWQLVRIWFVASRSTALTHDEAGREVPVVANDAQTLQRSIQSLKKVPLAMLIRDGWLIPVGEDELLPAKQTEKRKRGASTRASNSASTPLATLLEAEGERTSEVQDLPGRQFPDGDAAEPNGLPIENELLVARLLARIGEHADEGTGQVVRRHASGLPPAALAKVIESIELNHPRDRAAYAVKALRMEANERNAAA